MFRRHGYRAAGRYCWLRGRSFFLRFAILTFLAFGPKMLYLCNSGAGLSMRKSRFFSSFRAFPVLFSPYFFLKFPVLQLKFQVLVLKIQ